jgi:pimeloyl-ACP methyl ester carboxylesterase
VLRDGQALAVFEGPDNGPPLVLVHGYPDTHIVWDLVAERLSPHFHCIAYDVRGAGESAAPHHRADYRLRELRADLLAVIDDLSPRRSVHLVGHDWGSIQAWDAVIRARHDSVWGARIASYTTISGPCLHHVASLRRSVRQGGWRHRLELLRQLRHSWYVFAFQIPWLPEITLRRLNRRLVATRDRSTFHFGESLPDDSVHGLGLYRANIFHREALTHEPSTDIPVLLVVPTRDKYVTPAFTADLGRYASNLTRLEIDAGHWAPRSHPDALADAIERFVARS